MDFFDSQIVHLMLAFKKKKKKERSPNDLLDVKKALPCEKIHDRHDDLHSCLQAPELLKFVCKAP